MDHKKNLVFLVPSIIRTGPILGAVAIANSLSDFFSITLISIKGGVVAKMNIKEEIQIKDFSVYRTWPKKKQAFNAIIAPLGSQTVVFSMCFSADLFNVLFVKNVLKITSIRANLYINYKYRYGIILGYLLYFFHKSLFSFFDKVTVLSEAMRQQVANFSGVKDLVLIENFIDENILKKYIEEKKPKEHINFVFVGALIERKQPVLLIKTIDQLLKRGLNVKLDIVGRGPLLKEILNMTDALSIQENIIIHGHLSNPYKVISQGDIFVMPSLSEGISRASLEALFFGLPCVLRNVDGNSELINSSNGVLFYEDENLVDALMHSIDLLQLLPQPRSSLIPEKFSQEAVTEKLINLFSN